jgi:hypothetical protein
MRQTAVFVRRHEQPGWPGVSVPATRGSLCPAGVVAAQARLEP